MSKSKTIGIIGNGFVGKTLKRYWPNAKIYETENNKSDSLKAVLGQEFIFITKEFEDDCQNIGSRGIMASFLEGVRDGRKIIIKSTFAPGTTEYFDNKYGSLLFCYSPESLTEPTAWQDFINPKAQVLGLSKKSVHLRHELFEILPKSEKEVVVSFREAEMLKHNINSVII